MTEFITHTLIGTLGEDVEIITPALTAREILEQAYTHLGSTFVDDEGFEQVRWMSGDWVSSVPTQNGEETVQVCSVGAVLLAKQMLDLADELDERWAQVLAVDLGFREALRILDAVVRERHPRLHRHAMARQWEGYLDVWSSQERAQARLRDRPAEMFWVDAVVTFNDAEMTTHQDVLSLFEAAIKEAVRLEEQA